MTPTTCLAAVAITITNYALPENWGLLSGQIVLEGPVPARELIHRPGEHVKDAEVCSGGNLYKEDLVVDPATRGIAHIFVYLYRKPQKIHPAEIDTQSNVSVNMRQCAFVPHTALVQAGQSVEIHCADPILHNFHPHPLRNQPMGLMVAPARGPGKGQGTLWPTRVRESLPMQVKCDFHPWMESYLLIMDHPYMAVTDREGRFLIPNLPVGEHEFRLWHERVGYLDRRYQVTIKPGDNHLPPRKFPLSVFQPLAADD